MRRLLLAVLPVALLIAAPSASAAGHVTLQGPDVAAYYALVSLQGITPLPDQAVVVYTRPLTSSTWTRHDGIRSADDRSYTFHLRISTDYAYYATAGGTRSYTDVSHVKRAACSVSGPAFHDIPIDGVGTGPHFPRFASFTAVRDGVWAGVAVNPAVGDFAVIKWRSGAAPQVLARFSYRGHAFFPGQGGSVDIAAITPKGTVIGTVQGIHTDGERKWPMAWTTDHRQIMLSHSPNWGYFRILGVTDAGTIVGAASADLGSGSERLVTWASATSPYHLIARPHYVSSDAAVDAAGDLVFAEHQANGYDAYVAHLPGGHTRELAPVPPAGFANLALGAGRSIYGYLGTTMTRWNLGALSPTGPVPYTAIAGESDLASYVAVGRSGDVVFGHQHRTRHLRTADGALVDLPPEPVVDFNVYPGAAVDASGRVAFTSAADDRIHFLTCH